MIVKAFLAWAGLKAMPALHNEAVHDALNVKTAILAGHARIVRLSAAGDLAASAGDVSLGSSVATKQSEVWAALDELARRLD